MHSGQCECGQTKVKIRLPDSLCEYNPRACDCDFCLARGITYLSHPDGELAIESDMPLEIQKQGSNQASFITCTQCKTVIAASLQQSGRLIGALNAQLLSDFSQLQPAVTVSPKKLDASEKVARWQTLWLNIRVNGNSYF